MCRCHLPLQGRRHLGDERICRDRIQTDRPHRLHLHERFDQRFTLHWRDAQSWTSGGKCVTICQLLLFISFYWFLAFCLPKSQSLFVQKVDKCARICQLLGSSKVDLMLDNLNYSVDESISEPTGHLHQGVDRDPLRGEWRSEGNDGLSERNSFLLN